MFVMKKLDIAWAKNDKYYHQDGFNTVIHDDAPDDVKKSFEHYCQQCKELGNQDDDD